MKIVNDTYDMYNMYRGNSMANTVRKNILFSTDEIKKIESYCKRNGLNFSELVRKGINEYIDKSNDDKELLNYVLSKISYASKKEQEDFDNANYDLDTNEGYSELSIEDVLYDRL